MEQTILANGKGQNNLQQSIKGDRYSVDNALSSLGALSVSGSSAASSASASMNQGVVATGDSTLSLLLSGDNCNAQNSVTSLGDLSASTAASAGVGSVSLDQQVAGSGDTSLAVKLAQGSVEAGQEASVAYGVLSSSQSLLAGAGVAAQPEHRDDRASWRSGLWSLL